MPEDEKVEGYHPGDITPLPTRPWQPPDTPPCYLPQRDHKVPAKDMIMGPIGPWATGQVDWTPLAGMTGTRPVVDKYSITKYSTGEWRQHNAEVLSGKPIHDAETSEMSAKNALAQAYATTDKNFNDNTTRLKERAQEIYRWRADSEYACKAMSDEIVILEEIRQRLKSASNVLLVPEAIARECLDLRSNRLEPDLVRDIAEEELIKEMSLIGAIRNLYTQTLIETDQQMSADKAAKSRIEFDWSDKNVAYNTDSLNIGLTTKTDTILLKPGAIRLSDGQSSLGYWEHFCKENIEQAESMRQQSIDKRSSIDAMLTNTARDLRTQADRVDQSLAEKSSCTDELRIRLEEELRKTLQKLADIEMLCNNLNTALRQLELSMKVAQTRLDNRGFTGRPNVENCRDTPHMGLLEEVNSLGKSIADLKSKLDNANQVRNNLLQSRGALERELIIKKKSLYIDRERCGAIRSFYPSAAQLSGHE